MPVVPHCQGTVCLFPGSVGRFWKIGEMLLKLVRYFLLIGRDQIGRHHAPG